MNWLIPQVQLNNIINIEYFEFLVVLKKFNYRILNPISICKKQFIQNKFTKLYLELVLIDIFETVITKFQLTQF